MFVFALKKKKKKLYIYRNIRISLEAIGTYLLASYLWKEISDGLFIIILFLVICPWEITGLVPSDSEWGESGNKITLLVLRKKLRFASSIVSGD